MIRQDVKDKEKNDKDDEEDEGPSKEDRVKRFINSGRDKKFDNEKPMKGLKKKPLRPHIEWDEEEDYGYLEEV